MKRYFRTTALATAAAATVLLAACGQEPETATAGERLDATVSDVRTGATEMGKDAQEAGRELKAAGAQAGEAIADGAADMTITAKVNAALAADDQLSALQIDVDTEQGRVVLSGTAPDSASRERATTLANAVDGVVAVDNRLSVASAS